MTRHISLTTRKELIEALRARYGSATSRIMTPSSCRPTSCLHSHMTSGKGRRCHQFLNPAEPVDPFFDPAHSVKNASDTRAILEKSGKVLAVFAGHYHDGDYQQINGIVYIGLQSSAAYGNDVSYYNQYATVDVRANGKRYQVAVAGN